MYKHSAYVRTHMSVRTLFLVHTYVVKCLQQFNIHACAPGFSCFRMTAAVLSSLERQLSLHAYWLSSSNSVSAGSTWVVVCLLVHDAAGAWQHHTLQLTRVTWLSPPATLVGYTPLGTSEARYRKFASRCSAVIVLWNHCSEGRRQEKMDQRSSSNPGPRLFCGASATSYRPQSQIHHLTSPFQSVAGVRSYGP